MTQKKRRIQLMRPNIVGTIHSAGGFAAAKTSSADLVEVRVDSLPRPPEPAEIAALPLPAILTVRREDEGGSLPLTDAQRLSLYEELMPSAAALDVELRSLRALAPIVEGRGKRALIVSFHDFEVTPALSRLRSVAARARDGGADIVKIAAKTATAGDVARLLQLLDEADGPLAVMGMGPLGRASRLLFAKAGSVLNYGWLDKPQVPGQWGADDFRELVERA